jgi:hypothetical protein
MFLCSHKERRHGSFGISTSSLKWDQGESIYTNQERRSLVQIGLKLVNGLNHDKCIHVLHDSLDLGGIAILLPIIIYFVHGGVDYTKMA